MRRVVEIDPMSDPRWDELVTAHPQARVYQLGDFAEILHRCYGFEPCYLGLEDPDGRVVAGLPLMRTRGLYRGPRLVSLPLVPRAGPVAADAEDAAVLLRSACAMASEEGTRLVVRPCQEGYDELVPELGATGASRHWVVPLPPDPEQLRAGWRRAIRRQVKQSERNGLTVRDAESEGDLRRFYRLYMLNVRRFGVAPRPFGQMVLSWRILGRAGRVKVLLAEGGGKLLGGMMLHLLGDVMEARYIAADRRQYPKRPHHALYWNAQRWAIEHGYKAFDFGGGEGSLAAFKSGWSAEPVRWTNYVQAPASDRARRGEAKIENGPSLGGGPRPTAFVWRHCPPTFARLASGPLYRYLADPTR